MKRVVCMAIVSMVLLGAGASDAQTELRAIEPVTDAELLNPDPADWINWRRTLNGQGYSPLDQINRETVEELRLVWSWATPPARTRSRPSCTMA